MTVVDGEQLIAAGVSDLRAIEAVAPDLNVRTDTLFTHFSVRGVGSINNGELADAGVTVSLDGEYFNRPVALNASMMDLERVEVLRGPQGTLYGRNATGGAVNLVTRKPQREFGAGLSLEAGNYSSINAQGYLNVPISDRFAARLAVMSADRDGYLDNGPGGEGDDQDVKGARLSTLAELTEDLQIGLAFDYVDVDQSATLQYGVPIGTAAYPVPMGSAPSAVSIDVPRDGFPLASLGFFESEQKAVRGTLDYQLGSSRLQYLGAYRDNQTLSLVPLNGFIPESFLFDNRFTIRTQSHELRLIGDDESALTWQGGLFYSREVQDVARGLFVRALPPPTGSNGYVNFFYFPEIISRSKAAFAQVSGQATDTLKWTLGARHTQDDKSREGASFPAPGPPLFFSFRYPSPPTNTAAGVNRDRTGDWSKSTWLAGLDWQVRPDNLLYAKVSTGFKSGGFDNATEFEPEELTAYEVGSKNRFLDDRLQLNLAAFLYDYKDQQVSVFLDTTLGAQIINAGKSEVKGLEADLLFAITEQDRLHLTANFLDAEFETLLATEPRVGVDPTTASPQRVDLAGNEPVQSPDVTLTAAYDHVWSLRSGAALTGAVSTRYKSEYYVTVFNWTSDRQEAISNSDASLTYTSADGKWDLSAFVRNIEDERPLGYSSFTGGTINIYNFGIGGAPRTYGVRGAFRF